MNGERDIYAHEYIERERSCINECECDCDYMITHLPDLEEEAPSFSAKEDLLNVTNL